MELAKVKGTFTKTRMTAGARARRTLTAAGHVEDMGSFFTKMWLRK